MKLLLATLLLSLSATAVLSQNTPVIRVDSFTGDFGLQVNSCVGALPQSGGICDARYFQGTGASPVSITTPILLNKSVEIDFGRSTFVCNIAGSTPCIKIIKPSKLVMMPDNTPPPTPNPPGRNAPSPDNGTVIKGGTGFSGFLISVQDTADWATAENTVIEGGVLDGNGQTCSGIHIQNQFGVQVRDIRIHRPLYGVQLENTNNLWTEGSYLNNLMVWDPKIAGVSAINTGGTTSIANARWQRIYVNLATTGAVGISFGKDLVLASSRIDFVKMWAGASGTTYGIQIATPDNTTTAFLGTTISNFNVENSGPGAMVATSFPSNVIQPILENVYVQGTPLPSLTVGTGYQDFLVPEGLSTLAYTLVGGGQLQADDRLGYNTQPTYSFINNSGTGMYLAGTTAPSGPQLGFATGGPSAGILRGWVDSAGWRFNVPIEMIGTAAFLPAVDFDGADTNAKSYRIREYNGGLDFVDLTSSAGRMRIESSGSVTVYGNLTKGGGSFKIDHPLDPANKYLQHSFVESPEMMNIYNGIAILDKKGEVSVTLPDWFQALNRDFRYQLTSIGAPGPNLYVAQEVSGNHFRIAGGKPGAKVSWQLTGVRQDAYANANRIPIETEKPREEQGYYLHPEAFGLPKTKGIEASRHPEIASSAP